MKYLLIIVTCFYLVACSALDNRVDCYYGSVPQQYLVNNEGQFIDQNGKLVSEKVINPEFLQFQKCRSQFQAAKSPTINVIPRVHTHLNAQYHINKKLFELSDNRKIEGNGRYVKSVFSTEGDNARLQQEVFIYPGTDHFQTRFLADINQTEGLFKSVQTQGITYFTGQNNHGIYVIYVVKQLPSNVVSIVQLMSKSPFQSKEIPLLVQDLNRI